MKKNSNSIRQQDSLTHIGLFEGIGGFLLAARWAGWETIAWCEWNEFGQTVLKHHFPNATPHGDITKTDFTIYRGQCDVVTGGFPCQPYSIAGKRKGKEDERHLWPEMLRAIREIAPTWFVGENVRGLVKWNGGMVFDEVQSDLEAEGYEVIPYLLPACAVDAPHRRDRIWFVAYSASNRRGRRRSEGDRSGREHDIRERLGKSEIIADAGFVRSPFNSVESKYSETGPDGKKRFKVVHEDEFRNVTDTDVFGSRGEIDGFGEPGLINEKGPKYDWAHFPTQSPIRLRNDGISTKLSRYITQDLEHEISQTSKGNRIENLSEVWNSVLQEEVWDSIRRFYSLESKEILYQTMQLYSSERDKQRELSPFSEELSKTVLRHLQKYGEFGRSPQGRKLEKKRSSEFGDSLSFLPHEVALAARRFEAAVAKFETWHRNESIKAAGNAIVPQVAYQIFKAINEYSSQK